MTPPPQHQSRIVEIIGGCLDCPRRISTIAYGCQTFRCALTSIEISDNDHIVFPETCPLPRPAPSQETKHRECFSTYESVWEQCRTCELKEQCREKQAEHASKAAQAREDENKRIVKILEDYRFGLDYPDCPPGDTIKKLVKSLRTEAHQ